MSVEIKFLKRVMLVTWRKLTSSSLFAQSDLFGLRMKFRISNLAPISEVVEY
jgi:hypothetical protein